MKKMSVIIASLVLSALLATTTQAEDPISFGLTADFYSKYIWRGQNLDDDFVLQTGASATVGNLTAGIWGSFELTDFTGNEGQFTEVDYSLDYSSELPGIEGVGYSLGVIYYDFPSTLTKDTTELYWGLSLELPLNPSLTVYHDVDEAKGTYVSLAVGHSVEQIARLGPDMPVGLEVGVSLGWGSGSYNNYYWGIDESKLNDLSVPVSFPVNIAGWTVAPVLSYVTLVNSDIRDTDAYATDSDYFLSGISLSKTF